MDTSMQSTQIDEATRVRQTASGNLEAFNQLVHKYKGMTYNHARLMLDNSAQAEDVAQESFIKAFQNIGGFRGGSFRGWLLKVVTDSANKNAQTVVKGVGNYPLPTPNWI